MSLAKKSVQGLRREKNGEGPPLRQVQEIPPGVDGPPPDATLAGEEADSLSTLGTVSPADLAWAELAAPIGDKEGIRIGCLGVSGSGKTTGLKAFLAYLIEQQLVAVVIIHDVKNPLPQYRGTRIAGEAEIVIRKPAEVFPDVVVLRRRSIDHQPDLERAAQVTKHASYHGTPTVLVVDELSKALSQSGREFVCPTVQELLTEGRGFGASLLWSAQLPQRVPTVAYDMSRVLFFRCGRKVLNYLVDLKIVDLELAGVISRLPRGRFIIAGSEEEWNGVVYEVPPPKEKRLGPSDDPDLPA